MQMLEDAWNPDAPKKTDYPMNGHELTAEELARIKARAAVDIELATWLWTYFLPRLLNLPRAPLKTRLKASTAPWPQTGILTVSPR